MMVCNHLHLGHPSICLASKNEQQCLYGSSYMAIFTDFIKKKKQLLLWTRLPIGMFTLGLAISLDGPTFHDLQIVTDTDNETASVFYISGSCGYLVGAFLAGCLHGKMRSDALLSLLSLLAGGVTIAVPYCSTFYLMTIFKFVAMAVYGCFDTSLNAEHMRIWGDRGQSRLQLMHCSYAIGGSFGPLLAAPFLAEKYNSYNRTSILAASQTFSSPTGYRAKQFHWIGPNDSNITSDFVLGVDMTNGTTDRSSRPSTDVHYAYLITGIIIIVISSPFIPPSIGKGDSDLPSVSGDKDPEDTLTRKLPVKMTILLDTLLCLFPAVFICPERLFPGYLTTFLIDQPKHMSASRGATITTYFWIAYAIGRLASILSSKYLYAVRLCYIHLSLMLAAFIGFTLASLTARSDIQIFFTVVIGLSFSPIYPAYMSFAEAEVIKVTGRISALFSIGYSAGSIYLPYLIGYLTKHVSNMWFCYLMLITSVSTVALFLFLLLFNRCYLNKTYGTIKESQSEEQSYGTFSSEKFSDISSE